MTDEIKALRDQYLSRGGNGQQILDQMKLLEEESRSLEARVRSRFQSLFVQFNTGKSNHVSHCRKDHSIFQESRKQVNVYHRPHESGQFATMGLRLTH